VSIKWPTKGNTSTDGLLHKSGNSNKINYLYIKIVDAFWLRDILIKIEKEERVALRKALSIQICERYLVTTFINMYILMNLDLLPTSPTLWMDGMWKGNIVFILFLSQTNHHDWLCTKLLHMWIAHQVPCHPTYLHGKYQLHPYLLTSTSALYTKFWKRKSQNILHVCLSKMVLASHFVTWC